MSESAFTTLPEVSPRAEDILGPVPDLSKSHVSFIEVSTLSGSATVYGDSGAMGNSLDTELFLGLRERSDVIVVGSRTVLIEDYGGALPTEKRPIPAPIAVISNSFNIDPNSKFVKEAITAPLVIATNSALTDPKLAGRREMLQNAGIDFVDSGTGTATEIVQALSKEGFNRIDCEGGPGIFGLFIADKLVDQMYLTLDPRLTGSVEKNLVSDKATSAIGVANNSNLTMKLEKVAIDTDSTVFLRYGVSSTT